MDWFVLVAILVALLAGLGLTFALWYVTRPRPTRRHGARCPVCAWRPPIRPNWSCATPGCETKFDTFACQGVCPSCSTEQEQTACPSCNTFSPRAHWLARPAPAGPQPKPTVKRAASSLDQCPFCHDQVEPIDGVACASCLARHHDDCWTSHGACSACHSTLRYGAPEETEPPVRHRSSEKA